MARVIVGTAGHIDHGKTSLVRALTGIDCDRWEQEKTRGITIDLGFAHLTAHGEDGDLQIGFIDVPGHERFLHNALAGLGGVRVLLLVVAADEGVKPQTREHLDICSLLHIPSAVVALTKSDLVATDLLELAQLEVEELLAGGPFEGAPAIAVSSTTGEGVEDLRRALLEQARSQALEGTDQRPVRLPVDRAFHLKGAGVVVTGTLVSGSVATGDSLQIQPGEGSARVRSIQVHGMERPAAQTGERTSLQLAGAGLEDLSRGVHLVTPEAFQGSRSLLLRCRLLPDADKSISGFVPVRVHHFASETVGKMRPLDPPELGPGGEALVEVRLSQPLTAVRGDTVILRRPSPAATLGGGPVLDPQWLRHRGNALANALKALSGDLPSALRQWIYEGGEAGATGRELARRLGGRPEAVHPLLEELAAAGHLLEAPGSSGASGGARRWISPAVFQRILRRAQKVLASYFKENRLARGLPKAEAVQRILSARGKPLAAIYLDWLQSAKVLGLDGDLVTLPGHRAELTGEESKLARAIVENLDDAGLKPPSPGELQRDLGAKPQIVDGVVGYLVERGKLLRLPNGLILSARAVSELQKEMAAGGWEKFTVVQFKDHFGLSRKWAIPILEHLDSVGFTRRAGDQRLLVHGS
ncbi:MAG: selenocysteine-specific translation elongation factor [Acidobacteriota bacterium]|nr:selenocysteine-specific translation elongation factor [Acidobacteriota bacterium]